MAAVDTQRIPRGVPRGRTVIEPCGGDCPLREAGQLARKRYLEKHARYNTSSKGQARNRAYEAAHPERKLRWEPARNKLRAAVP
jgi:hypothetical protein